MIPIFTNNSEWSGLSAIAGGFNPGQLPGTPREWLAGPQWCYTDVAATIPAGDTDPVAAWVDRWQGFTMSQIDPLLRPVLRNIGGRWVVRFDGVNDAIGASPAITGARTIAMAYTQTVKANSVRVLNSTSVVSGVGPRRTNINNATIFADFNNLGTIRGSSVFSDDSNPHVFMMRKSASGFWQAYADNDTNLATSNVTNNFGPLGIGGTNSSETFTGDIYSVVDVNSGITDADWVKLRKYLSRLYGGNL